MKRILAVVAAVALGAHTARTDIILAWEISGDSSPEGTVADTIIAGINTGGSLNALTSVGLGITSTANSFSRNGWNLTDTFSESDDYVTFTLQPTSGNQLTLTSLDFKINGSGSNPNNGRWGYSIGGGSFVLQPTFTISTTLALATWDFADFTTTQSVEFRFWSFGAGNSSGGGASASTGTVRVPGNTAGNDLVLNGTVTAIPEPGTFALLGLGALGLWMFGRRRRA
jgi:hypothetical protein